MRSKFKCPSFFLYSRYYEVKNRTESLPRAFLDILWVSVFLYCKVKTISQSDEGTLVSYKTDEQSSPSTIKGDAVLVTATTKAALYIDFEPHFSTQKREALRWVHNDNAVKIVLAFSERFWENDGFLHMVWRFPPLLRCKRWRIEGVSSERKLTGN